uniref:DnaJ (Hsp40) homolog, subfamily C, member 14 n=1 Tax=Lepisosteus oculatus TaxID=7918 RepID=W5MA12_LEPOC|nr:PREDICTED: dnaJ homolog subfamily C member 14 [Lepisosteus oculatus]XP_015199808.1 PREDICTED: dnaJ homolog subfamily C member 14 [Lepisosteus oculatus]
MDKKARSAGRKSSAPEPARSAGGACHGLPLPPGPLSACGDGGVGPGDPSAQQTRGSPVRVESCGALGDLGEEAPVEPVPSLDELLDAEPETPAAGSSSHSPPPLPNGALKVEEWGGWRAGGGSEQQPEPWDPQDPQDPISSGRLQSVGEEDAGSSGGFEAESKVDSNRQRRLSGEPGAAGSAGWEELEKEEEDEGEEEEDGGTELRVDGISFPRRAGKRQKGRERDRPAAGEHPISSSSSKPPVSSGGRHKQARRRNNAGHHHQSRSKGSSTPRAFLACWDLLSESVWPRCESCLRMVVELIVLVTHRCGECVEAGGALAYSSGSQLLSRATDMGAMRSEAKRLSRGLHRRGRRAGAALLDWGTVAATRGRRLLSALLSLLCLAFFVSLGCLRWAGSAMERRCGGRPGRAWEALCETRVWGLLVGLWGKVRTAAWGLPSVSSSSSPPPSAAPESPGGTGRCQPGQELERLLALAQVPEEELDPFKVLGLEASATDTELKRAYRQLAVLVHPDKNKHPRAGEAFKVLRAAWDIVSNPETRREYELKRMAETELTKSMNEFLTKLHDDLKEAMNTMMCSKCEGKHKRFEMERDPGEARFCAECSKRHSAEEGDFWAESSMLGLRITYFALMDGKVYDITEWAGCQRISISPDTHRVPYHISFGAKNSGGAGRHRTPSETVPGPGSAADLQDFFNRIFQGSPNGMANGSFFPPPPPPPHPGAAHGSHTFPAAPTPPGGYPPGAGRAESAPRTESGGRPRRRKKLRRPFQR